MCSCQRTLGDLSLLCAMDCSSFHLSAHPSRCQEQFGGMQSLSVLWGWVGRSFQSKHILMCTATTAIALLSSTFVSVEAYLYAYSKNSNSIITQHTSLSQSVSWGVMQLLQLHYCEAQGTNHAEHAASLQGRTDVFSKHSNCTMWWCLTALVWQPKHILMRTAMVANASQYM